MTSRPVDNAELVARVCTGLPELAAKAARHGWAHTLEAALADIRAGVPVARAMAAHYLPLDIDAAGDEQARISRGDPGVLDELNIDPVTVTGAYTCPATPPCPRRARPGPDGHEPRCGVHATTMILRRG